MIIKWTNKVSGEQGFVKKLNRKEKFFENTFERKEANNFSMQNGVSNAIVLLNEYCSDNIYEVIEGEHLDFSNNLLPNKKLKVVKEYLETDLSYREVAEKYGISKSTAARWVYEHQEE